MKSRVLITTPFLFPGDDTDRRLQEAGLETIFDGWHGDRTEAELIGILDGISAAIVSIDPFTRRVFDAAKKLKVVSRTGVGYDSIDVKSATDRGVAVCTAPGANNVAVAEFTLTLIMACARRLVENLDEVRRGGWARRAGRDVGGSVLGIIGLGSIGKEVAKRAHALGMRLLAFDPSQDGDFAAAHGVKYVSLEELLRESDFVSIHCFLDERTRHLINAERLSMMKATAYLINTSRGGTVDTEALYHALREKAIAGAALDVFEQEPLEVDSPLRQLENAFLFPHVAANSANANREMGLMAAENVVRILRGEPPLHVVNPEVLKD